MPRTQRTVFFPWERRPVRFALARFGAPRLLAGAIVGIAVLGFALSKGGERRKLIETRATIARTDAAVARFRAVVGRCPQSVLELVHPPDDRARVLREVPRDAWSRALVVRCPATWNGIHADITSLESTSASEM